MTRASAALAAKDAEIARRWAQKGKTMTQQKYMRPGLDFAVGKTIEELGELQSALGKTLRWGWRSVNPDLPQDEQEKNVNWVLREMADVRGALENLENELRRSVWSLDMTPPTPPSERSGDGARGGTEEAPK